jgi:hypothetical protein
MSVRFRTFADRNEETSVLLIYLSRKHYCSFLQARQDCCSVVVQLVSHAPNESTTRASDLRAHYIILPRSIFYFPPLASR